MSHLLEFRFWVGILAVLGFIWVLTSCSKFIVIFLEGIMEKAEREFYVCPVCKSQDTRQDYDYPDTMRCCDKCGADFIEETGEIILDPRDII